MDFYSLSALLLLLVVANGAIASVSYFKKNKGQQPVNLTLAISGLLFLVPPFALIYMAFNQLSSSQSELDLNSQSNISPANTLFTQQNMQPKRAHLVLVK